MIMIMILKSHKIKALVLINAYNMLIFIYS